MEKKRNEDDDDYWGSAHKGYDFGEIDKKTIASDTKLSKLMRKDDLNQLDLLKYDGLDEVVENKSTQDFLPFNISQGRNEIYTSKLAKSFNPLIINQKKQAEYFKCGPEEMVKNMILGLEYSLYSFKGKREKMILLDTAVKSHDGNAILEVVLFLRASLKKSIFQREIIGYPDAVNVYLAYLEEDHESDELANMLLLLNKAEEAAILKYAAAVTFPHPEGKLKWIENCLSTHFQLGVTDAFLRQSVEEHQQILEEQIKLEKYNHAHPTNAAENLAYFVKLTGKASVVDSSILCSLIFCCLNCYNSNEFSFACPEKIKSNYNLSKKQYTWAIFRTLVSAKRWLDIDDLFISKNWLGGTKMRSCIPYSRILEILFKENAPNEILKKYVSFIQSEDEKLILAKKYSCHSVVIEVLKNNKDRIGLEEYKASLPPHSVDFYTAADILKNSVIHWKN